MAAEQKKAKVQKLIEMGERVHMLVREGKMQDGDLIAMSAQVTELDKVINAPLGKVPPNRNNGICPQCNVAFEGAFCTACGLNIEEFFAKPVFTCDKCGLMVNEEDFFCGVCGSKRGA
ncbi:MAG: hypothetical protein FWC71_01285 [Defluviitaleaceae bacterium]|nr:hypothetical protein [Defluviitaleaceae bacterium]